MTQQIPISRTLGIRDSGYSEAWLQDQISADPTILGLGEFDQVWKEKQESRGGRLDFLLGNSDNGTMYEVEVMLGPTDEKHIIHTLEYWDTQRRHFPKRSHTAVLVAERFERRFFNVIQLLSGTIPIIAIRVGLIDAEGKRFLHFTTILDVYEEPETESSASEEARNESWWRSQSAYTAATLDTARALLKVASPTFRGRAEMGYSAAYVSIKHDLIQFKLYPSRGRTRVKFYVDDSDAVAVSDILKTNGFELYSKKPWGDGSTSIQIMVDQEQVEANATVFQRLAEYVKKCSSTGKVAAGV